MAHNQFSDMVIENYKTHINSHTIFYSLLLRKFLIYFYSQTPEEIKKHTESDIGQKIWEAVKLKNKNKTAPAHRMIDERQIPSSVSFY